MPNESFQNPGPAKKVEILDANGDTISQEKKSEIIKDAKKKAQALEALKRKLVIVDASHLAEMEARDAADAHMTEEKGKAGFFKRLWKHTFFDEYYRQKELNKIRTEIADTNNIYTAIDKDKHAHDTAMEAITTRFASEYEEAINKKVGEDRSINTAETLKAKHDIQDLIVDYAQGNISEEVFTSEKNKIFGTIDNTSLKGASMYADNVFEMAKNAKLAIEHGAKTEELDLDFDIIVGKAKSSIKTEARNNWVDKAVSGIKDTTVGKYVNPATVSTALGIVYSVGAFTGKRLLRNKFSHAMTFGGTAVASALLSAANESQRLSEERRQHGREMAKGGIIEGDTYRRESMEKYAYQTETATNLINNLRSSLFTKDSQGQEVPKQVTQAELDVVMNSIREIEARNALADQKHIDLISYSSPAQIEKERTELTILLARAKVELRSQFETHLKGVLPEGETFDSYLSTQIEVAENAFLDGEKGITRRDKAFAGLKRRRAGIKMFKTLLIGTAVGALVQEGVAAADGMWDGHREGIIEGLMHRADGTAVETSNTTQTPLEHLRGYFSGHPSHMMASAHEYILGNNHFRIPEGANILPHGDGTYTIVHEDRIISDHIKLNFDKTTGALDPESLARLEKEGIFATTSTHLISGTEVVAHTPKEYIDNHPGSTTRIHREGWFDNDTKKFDKNELKLWNGGVNNTGIDANGNFVFNIKHMTPDGSYHHGLSTNAQEMMKGHKLTALFSLSRDTQFNVYEIPIDEHGNILVDKNSELGKLMFENKDGHMIFKGKFAEVAQSMGKAEDGLEKFRVLATEEGKGIDTISDTIPSATPVSTNVLELPLDTEAPYFIPAVPRVPLEPIAYKKNKEDEDAIASVDKNTLDKTQKPTPPEEIPAGGFRAEDKEPKAPDEADKSQYSGLQEDIDMLNKRIQASQGIITLTEDDFVSDYGRERFNALKSILEGKNITFNKVELQKIGDKMDTYLTTHPAPKMLTFKEFKSSILVEERKLAIAKKLGDTAKIKELTEKIRKMKRIVTLHDTSIKTIRKAITQAETENNQDEVTRLENKLRETEKKVIDVKTLKTVKVVVEEKKEKDTNKAEPAEENNEADKDVEESDNEASSEEDVDLVVEANTPEENATLAQEFINKLTSYPELMEQFKQKYEKYINYRNYSNLDKKSPYDMERKNEIDAAYTEYKSNPDNKKVKIADFLKTSVDSMNKEFARELLARE